MNILFCYIEESFVYDKYLKIGALPLIIMFFVGKFLIKIIVVFFLWDHLHGDKKGKSQDQEVVAQTSAGETKDENKTST